MFVVAIDACPSHAWTVVSGTPRRIHSHAAVCRRSCRRIGGRGSGDRPGPEGDRQGDDSDQEHEQVREPEARELDDWASRRELASVELDIRAETTNAYTRSHVDGSQLA